LFLLNCVEFAKQQVQPTLYSYNVLRVATKDFHIDNKLGQGGFGIVYQVSLSTSCPFTINHAINILQIQFSYFEFKSKISRPFNN
jgi:hypothetical protein